MLIAGKVSSVEDLAVRLKKERKHVGKIIAPAFLAPDLVRTILRGERDRLAS
jgi:hypothetical protein